MLPNSSGDQVLQLSASSDSWLWRRKCLIIAPQTAKSAAVIVKDSRGGVPSNNKKQEEIDGSESDRIRCRYGEVKVASLQFAEQGGNSTDWPFLGPFFGPLFGLFFVPFQKCLLNCHPGH